MAPLVTRSAVRFRGHNELIQGRGDCQANHLLNNLPTSTLGKNHARPLSLLLTKGTVIPWHHLVHLGVVHVISKTSPSLLVCRSRSERRSSPCVQPSPETLSFRSSQQATVEPLTSSASLAPCAQNKNKKIPTYFSNMFIQEKGWSGA